MAKEERVAKAELKFLRVSPKKVRTVLPKLKDKSAQEALQYLKFIPKKFSRELAKLIQSAISNAENKGFDKERMVVKEFICNEGPRLKRFRPGHRGMAFPYTRKLCHLKVVLEEVKDKKTGDKKRRKTKSKKYGQKS